MASGLALVLAPMVLAPMVLALILSAPSIGTDGESGGCLLPLLISAAV